MSEESPEYKASKILDLSARINDALAESPVVESPKVGVHIDVPIGTYHSWPGASNSRFNKLYGKTPAHLKAYLDAPSKETEALRVGRALHVAILEPDLFPSIYLVAEQCGATKKGDGLRCTNAGVLYSGRGGWLCGVHGKGVSPDESRVVLPPNDYAICVGARDSVYKHPMAGALLRKLGNIEQSLVWVDEDTGLLCRARHDFHTEQVPHGAIVDVKSTADASPDAFMWSVAKYGYARQGALYLEGAQAHGLPLENFVIVAVEKEPPFATAVYLIDSGSIDAGGMQLKPLKRTYKRCLDTNEWPGYPDDIVDIALPARVFEQIDQETQGEENGV